MNTKIKVPQHIIDLAANDVKSHGLSDGSVKKEDKNPEVLKFISEVFAEINKSNNSFTINQASFEEIVKQIYPNEHTRLPVLKQNSALSQLFAARKID